MKEKWYNEKIYLVIVMTVYIILGSILIYFHEPFRDEAQAWLIARDTNIIEMFSLSKSEGSPMLWHCLVNILTTLGLPYISINIMHFILNIIAIYFLNKYAPFSKYIKVGITFSHMMAYQYLVLARSYVLVPLLLFMIAIIYKKRHEKTLIYCILLLLLQNACLYSIPIAITLFVTFVIEKIKLKQNDFKSIIIFIIVAVVMLGSILLLVNDNHNEQLYHTNLPTNFEELFEGAVKALRSISTVVLPFEVNIPLKGITGLIILLLTTISLWKDKKVLIIFLISTIVIGGIFAFLNLNITLRHSYVYVIIYLFCSWIKEENNEIKYIKSISQSFVIFAIAMQIVLLITYGGYEIAYDFSNAVKIKEFIKEQGYEDYKIFAFRMPFASSILPYFPDKRALAIEDFTEHTYVIWNKDFNNENLIFELDVYRMMYMARKDYNGKVLFISDDIDGWQEKYINQLEKIYPVNATKEVIEEELHLYKLKDY